MPWPGPNRIAVDFSVLDGVTLSRSLDRAESASSGHSVLVSGHEDWYSLRCGRCGEDHQGREYDLAVIARAHPGERQRMP